MYKSIAIIAAFVLLLAVAFMLGRGSKGDIQPPQQTDVSKYEKVIDSLNSINKLYSDSNKALHKSIDSLKVSRINNNKKVKHEVNQIRSFTPTSRERWNDSVLRANGLK